MKLSLLFLIIASTPFTSNDLALASGESERTIAFRSVRRYLRASSTIEQEDEEREPKLTQEQVVQQVIAAIEQFLPKLSRFSYASIKDFAKQHVEKMESEKAQMELIPDPDHNISPLFKTAFLEELRRHNSFQFEKYVDIGLYLVLLEVYDGDIWLAAQRIDKAMDLPSQKDSAVKMEEGQFLLWSRLVGSADQVKETLFHGRPQGWSSILVSIDVPFSMIDELESSENSTSCINSWGSNREWSLSHS